MMKSRTSSRAAPWLLLAAVGLVGCSDKNSGIDVDLQQEVYLADFGAASGTLPTIACSTSGDSLCNQLPVVSVDASQSSGTPASATIAVGCDTDQGRCYAQANARVADAVDVQLDSGFVGKLEGRLISFVRVIDLRYRVPANTLTFNVPSIEVFVGPAGTVRETDSGVARVGSTPALAAGTTLTDGNLAMDDNSPGRSTIENAIRDRKPFAFVLVFSPKITSGNPLPAGMIEVDLTPRLTIGF